MSEELEDQGDGLGCFKFQLLLDDFSASSHKKRHLFMSAQAKRERGESEVATERMAHNFEYSPSPEERGLGENTFKRVFELLAEAEEPKIGTYSEKKSKKAGKNLTPETNYTQKVSDINDGKSVSAKKEFNIWGSYKWSRDDDAIAKKTLTAYSEAFEPDDISMEFEKKAQVSIFDLDSLRNAKTPKKNSMAASLSELEYFSSCKPGTRKMSFQGNRFDCLFRKPPLLQDYPKKLEVPSVKKHFAPSLGSRIDFLLNMISQKVETNLEEHNRQSAT